MANIGEYDKTLQPNASQEAGVSVKAGDRIAGLLHVVSSWEGLFCLGAPEAVLHF